MPETVDLELYERHNDHRFRTPCDISINEADIRRVLIIGSCMANTFHVAWGKISNTLFDYMIENNAAELVDNPPHPISEYDFQVYLPPLRPFIREVAYLRIAANDEKAAQDLFEDSVAHLLASLELSLAYNKKYGLLTFVSNFLTPQQNPMGRLLPRYSFNNPVYYIEQLNRRLEQALTSYNNAYILDIDSICSTFGKRFIRDDSTDLISHGGHLTGWAYGYDVNRLEVQPAMEGHYTLRPDEFEKSVWSELVASYRTIRQIDSVKLVVVDLDDTLWRGVLAEGQLSSEPIGGWPAGIAEALLYLKKRGVLLAIISKNDPKTIESAWEGIFNGLLKLDDFAVRQINWASKDRNMAEILSAVNLLPKNVVFIDDNPVERAAVQSAFPEIRALGSHPYYLKRILLWSGETQVPFLTDESGRRTEMVQAQVERGNSQKVLSRSEFLVSLNLRVEAYKITTGSSRWFERAFELLNKTNQFNTTGRRWKIEDLLALMLQGASLYAFYVEDKYTKYGMVSIAIVLGSCIQQFVMSCRVIGLDAEIAAISVIESDLVSQGYDSAMIRFIQTESNSLCGELYKKIGYSPEEGLWVKTPLDITAMPEHVKLTRHFDANKRSEVLAQAT